MREDEKGEMEEQTVRNESLMQEVTALEYTYDPKAAATVLSSHLGSSPSLIQELQPYHLEQFFEVSTQSDLLQNRFCLYNTKLDNLWQELHLLSMVEPWLKNLTIKSSNLGQ